MKKLKSNITTAAFGIAIGFVNGLLGAGGGMIAVPIFKKMGLNQKESHVNAVAVILPISIFSALLYLSKGYVELSDAVPFIPTGILGAVLGTYFLKKISPLMLKRIFGGFMIYAGVRLLLR